VGYRGVGSGTRRALAFGVDTTIFSLKRAHHATLAFARRMLREFGITPARYDLLRVVKGTFAGSIEQSNLVQILGVSPPVVSRMVKQLVELGLVDHYRYEECPRIKVVEVTKKAVELLERIRREVFEWDFPWLALRFALDPHERRGRAPRQKMFRALLVSVRRWFGDAARGDPYDLEEFLGNIGLPEPAT